ncbi:hypothetical protein [Sorangium sp. So ce1078]|uniref:hypothetical protein n=1 Tax=Sorangium sp. So ce1078 TaxID=3133329 RepID=UPI003F623E10
MPRAPIGRLSPSELPAPLREQASGAQDAASALGLAHVELDGDWLHPRRGGHGEGFVGRRGFRVLTVLPQAVTRPSPAPPDSTPDEPDTRPELAPPRPLLERDLLAVAARLDYQPIVEPFAQPTRLQLAECLRLGLFALPAITPHRRLHGRRDRRRGASAMGLTNTHILL